MSVCVCFGLLHLDFFFALQQKCMVSRHAFAFAVGLASAVSGPVGVHGSCGAYVGLLRS